MIDKVSLNKGLYERLVRRVQAAGGELLSGAYWYDNSAKKVQVRCESGHIFQPNIHNLTREKNPTWCSHPECVSKRITFKKAGLIKQDTLRNIEEILKAKGGRLLEGDGCKLSAYLKIQCSRHHEPFSLRTRNILAGEWCRKCILHDEFESLATSRGGSLISGLYETAKKKLQWRCGSCSREWFATPDAVKSGSWCPACGGSEKLDEKDIYQRLQPVANRRGITSFRVFRGTRATASDKRFDWNIQYTCELDHQVTIRVDHFERGVGCGRCKLGSVGEVLAGQILEHLTHNQFLKVRPNWLTDDDGARLELDGYCEEIGLAFEYQGLQHYQYVHRFHSTPNEFEIQTRRDRRKVAICARLGIRLIRIPYTVDLLELEEFLRQELRVVGVSDLNAKRFPMERFRNVRNALLEELQDLATSRGGRLLSKAYLGSQTPMEWQCGKQHSPWKASAGSIKSGTWCPQCGDVSIGEKNATSADELARLASLWHGKYLGLSPASVKGRKHLFQCVNGHQFEKSSSLVKKGSWCAKCAKLIVIEGIKVSLSQLQKVALSRGGALLSKYVQNTQQKLAWQCGSSHIWIASGNSVARGSWCPQCAGRAEINFSLIDFLSNEAKAHNQRKSQLVKAQEALENSKNARQN